MRSFGKIHAGFLKEFTDNNLSDSALSLALHVIAGRHSNTLGCVYAPFGYLAVDLNISRDEIMARVQELHNSQLFVADFGNEVLLFNKNEYREAPNTGDQAKGLIKIFDGLPDSFVVSRLADLMLNHKSIKFYPPSFVEKLHTISELHDFELESSLTRVIVESQQNNRTTEQQNNKTLAHFENERDLSKLENVASQEIPTKKRKVKKRAECEAFNEFYERYPRKKSPGDALKAWNANKCKDHFTAIMANLAEREEKDPDWHSKYKFNPYPASFLRDEAWKDVIEVPDDDPSKETVIDYAVREAEAIAKEQARLDALTQDERDAEDREADERIAEMMRMNS